MKRLMTLLTLIIFSHTSFAQDNNGKWSVGASMYYNEQNNTRTDMNGISSEQESHYGAYNARLGYFFSDNFIIGLTGMYYNNASENIYTDNTNSSKNDITDIGIFSRYYHMFKESKFGYFLELNATYTFGTKKTESTYSNNPLVVSKGDLTGYNFLLQPGIIYYVHPKIGLETRFALISYSNSETEFVTTYEPAVQPEYRSKEDANGWNTSLTLNSISIGVSYYFGKGKN